MIANSLPGQSPRKAILVFADPLQLDLARRGFPEGVRPFFHSMGDDALGCAEAEVHIFTRGGARKGAGRRHPQTGNTFRERFENALEEIAALGYDEIVAIGRDCPGLASADIRRAFAQLQQHRLVLGPDHRGGCYLLAFRASDRHLLRDVRWLRNTDCAELRGRCAASEVFLLAIKYDLDSWSDLRIVARGGDAIGRLAFFLLKQLCAAGAATDYFVDLASQRIRVRWQMPPPAFAD